MAKAQRKTDEELKNRGEEARASFLAADHSLSEKAKILSSFFAESPFGIALYDSDGKLIGLNKATLDMFGVPDIAGLEYPRLFDDPNVPSDAKRRLRIGETVRYELRFDFEKAKRIGLRKTLKSGIAYLDVTATPLGLEGKGALEGYVLHALDITRHKLMEDALRDLSRRLVEVQEMERRHIARELHDQIGQALTGLKLLLEMAVRRRAEDFGASLEEAQRLIHELITRVHDLSLDLRPSMLDDLGLLPTLLWHFEHYTAQTGVQVMFEHKGLRRRFPPEVETAVYRIVQETLTNVARHANVREAVVRLWADKDSLAVQIEDHGIGFDFERTLITAASSGLVGMRERAVALGGQLLVNSAPGQGTRLVAQLPLLGVTKRRRTSRHYY